MKSAASKEKTIQAIFEAVIELDFKKGHLRWSMSELARTSGITRSLIYHYFGASPLEILKTAVQMFSDECFGFTELEATLWREGKWADSILITRKKLEAAPALIAFYTKMRISENELGKHLRSQEKRYLKKIEKEFPHLSKNQIQMFFGVFFGLTLAPYLTDDAVKEAVEILNKHLKFKRP